MTVRKLCETVCLFLLLAVVALRPLIAERYDSAGSPTTMALGEVRDPLPLSTLLLDLVILLAAGVLCLSRLGGGAPSYHRTGLEWGAALVAVAAVVSCLLAGNKRLAMNATIDWICMLVLALTLAQLAGHSWRRKLVLGVVLASACVQAEHCLEQVWDGFDQTWQHYQGIREEFWARQGVPLDSGEVELFERRMQAREADGFLQHSNVTGSHLVLCALPALGLAINRWKRPTAIGALMTTGGAMSMVVVIVVAAATTKSLGAAVSGACGLVVWTILGRTSRWSPRSRQRLTTFAWIAFAFGVLAVVGHGWFRGGLPGWSLTFRWQYWVASARMFQDHWLTGVGRENFGRHYLQYKSIESPEEVANPHNLLVQAGCDWGIVGLVGVLLLLYGWSRKVTDRGAETIESQTPSRFEGPSSLAPLAWTIGLLFVVTFARLAFLGSDDPNFLTYSAGVTGLVWGGAFCVVLFGPSDGKWHHGCVTAGLVAFLLHEMINFALFVPGSATTFFALVGLSVAEQGNPASEPVGRRREVQRLLTVLGAMILVAWFGVIPVARSRAHLEEAWREASRPVGAGFSTHPAWTAFDAAAQADPWDPVPAVANAEWLMSVGANSAERSATAYGAAVLTLRGAAARDPRALSVARLQVHTALALARVTDRAEDFQSALGFALRAQTVYPQSPAGLVRLADVELEAGERTKSQEYLRDAQRHYLAGLALDDGRLSWETLRRFRERERAEINGKIARTQTLLDGR